MPSNIIDPQSMTNTQIQLCGNCGQRVSEKDIICLNCKKNLSEVGRNISLSISDSIKVSDYIKLSKKERKGIPKSNIEWDSESLTFFGVAIGLVIGIFSLLTSRLNLYQAFTVSLIATALLFVTITKVRIVKQFVIKVILWFLNK